MPLQVVHFNHDLIIYLLIQSDPVVSNDVLLYHQADLPFKISLLILI